MNNRWKIELCVNGKVTKTLRNQTGNQLRKISNKWAENKNDPSSEYYKAALRFEAEPDVKVVK